MQTSPLFPDDTTWSTKHKQKPTKQSTEALLGGGGGEESFSKELLCSPYSHYDSDNAEMAGQPWKLDKLRHRRDNWKQGDRQQK